MNAPSHSKGKMPVERVKDTEIEVFSPGRRDPAPFPEKTARRDCREWYRKSECIQSPITSFVKIGNNIFLFFCYLKFFSFFCLVLGLFMCAFVAMNKTENEKTNAYQSHANTDILYQTSINNKPNFKVKRLKE